MPDFAALDDPLLFWTLAVFCGMLVGFAKTGVPGSGILNVPVMAMIFPPGLSTGILLPMLSVGDVFTVSYYRRHAVWTYVCRALPWAMSGIVLGFFIIREGDFSDTGLKRMIGAIVLVVLGLGLWVKRHKDKMSIPESWWFAATLGLLGGFSTMAANAAGPIWVVYLMAVGLPKEAFLGTAGWTFLILNLFKIPFSYALGYIDADTLLFDAKMIPAIGAGALLGIFTAKRLPQAVFDGIVKVLTAIAALRLLAG